MNYEQISKDVMKHLYQAHEMLTQSELEPQLRALVELRVSQINGCAYCCAMHAHEARQLGIEQTVLDRLSGWSLSSAFNDQQKIALAWAESVTQFLPNRHDLLAELHSHFSEKEIADLTLVISLMNAFNRIAISIGDHH
ncbi:carboxymuconolactone decarboxylase family protein [Neisseria sp. Ec49-e6-T10]|uniref:carboxymuconolactone decarboxylase family protein n=1 Tax=Neisseria sp. Ec49-e6-T10 TaxID=3140744 RepID=UPI003EB9CE4A